MKSKFAVDLQTAMKTALKKSHCHPNKVLTVSACKQVTSFVYGKHDKNFDSSCLHNSKLTSRRRKFLLNILVKANAWPWRSALQC